VSYVIICLVALLVSALTLFSGFGLGTLLMPAFALFFPVKVAVAATAVVHLANNLFKVALVGKDANWRIVLLFGLPAAVMAVVGAMLLERFADFPPLWQYSLGGQAHSITVVKLVIAGIMAAFALLESSRRFESWSVHPRYIPVGGAISGFFGGLSGHQGALRAAFLVRAGLSKEAFIGTSAVCAVIVDCSRLLVYGTNFLLEDFANLESEGIAGLIAAGCLAAFLGTFIGTRLVKKVTILLLAIALGSGLIPDK
jgi:uncharacterized membrane protein YfcA